MKKHLSILLAITILMMALSTVAFAGVDETATYSYYTKPGTYTVDVVISPYPQTTYRTYYFSGKNTVRNAILSTVSEKGYITGTPQFGEFNQEVTIDVFPDDGYTIDTIEAYTLSGENVQLFYAGGNTYTFTMPSEKVIINPTFKTKTIIPVVSEPTKETTKEEKKASVVVSEPKTVIPVVEETEVEEKSNGSGIWILIAAVLIVVAFVFYKKKKNESVGPML